MLWSSDSNWNFVIVLQEFHHRFHVQTVSASSKSACFLGGIRTLNIFLPVKTVKIIILFSQFQGAVPTLTFCWCFFLISFPVFLSIWAWRWADCLVMFLSDCQDGRLLLCWLDGFSGSCNRATAHRSPPSAIRHHFSWHSVLVEGATSQPTCPFSSSSA